MDNFFYNLNIIFILIKKDIKESMKNRTVLMIIMLPLFASLTFSLIDTQQLVRNFEIGISGESSQEVSSFIESNFQNFSVKEYNNLEAGIKDTASGNIDAVISYNNQQDNIEDKYEIYLDSRDTMNYFILRENISMLLKDYHDIEDEVQFSFNNAAELKAASSILPVWLTVTVTMIGLMLISGSLSEEKDDYTLAALLVSRVKAQHIIIAKSFFALFLTIITSFLMGVFNNIFSLSIERLFAALIVISTAAFVFSGFGILISLLTDSQASARSVSTVLYFPIIFPALVADVSPLTQKLARFFPTHYLYQALDKTLVYSGSEIDINLELLLLLSFALLFYIIIFIYLKRTDSFVE